MTPIKGFKEDVVVAFEVLSAFQGEGQTVELRGIQVFPQPAPNAVAETIQVKNPEALKWSYYGKTSDGRVEGVVRDTSASE